MTADEYDTKAAKLQAILESAYPDCQWWVSTLRYAPDSVRDEMLEQDRFEVEVRRDGYGARVPTRTAAADDPDFARRVGEIAIYTLNQYKARQQRT